MYLRYQGASRIEYPELATLCFVAHGAGNSMGAEHDSGGIRHFVEFIDEDGTQSTQTIDHEAIMYHFVTYVDWRTELLQRLFDDFDCTVDAGTKSARAG